MAPRSEGDEIIGCNILGQPNLHFSLVSQNQTYSNPEFPLISIVSGNLHVDHSQERHQVSTGPEK